MKNMTKEQAFKVAMIALENTYGWDEFGELKKVECGAGRACENGLAWSISNCIYICRDDIGNAHDYIISYTDYDGMLNFYRVERKDGICFGYKYFNSLYTNKNQLTLCAEIVNMLYLINENE